MKRPLRILLALCAALCLAAPSFAAYTISVETFRNSSGRHVPVDSIMDMMITELVNSGTFQVVERDRLDVIAREQRMGQSGLIDSNTASRTGRLAGAQYMMTGAVTKYSASDTAGGGIIGGGSSLIGGLINTNTAYVTLDVRLVDTTPGAIVYAGRAEGAGTNVMGGLLRRYAGFGTGRSGGQLATATHKAITKVVANLRAAIGAGAAPGRAEGFHVLDAKGARNVTIDAGTTTGGARKGQYYAGYREGEAIRDLHCNVLDGEHYYVAVIQVIEARPQYSKAKIVRGGGLRRGDGIEPIRKPDDVKLDYE